MLYEIVATVRPRSVAEVKDIARTAGNLILQNGGVIRGITNWGVFALPKPLRNRSEAQSSQKPKEKKDPWAAELSNKHTVGHYFIMRFDSSAKTQHTLRKTWAADPRLLRFSVVKMGEKFSDTAKIGGKAEEWLHAVGNEGEVNTSTPYPSASESLSNAFTFDDGKFVFPGSRS